MSARRSPVTSVLIDMPEPDFAAECARWDEALVQHFVLGVPRGDPVFLSVHEEILDRLGHERGRTSDDFLALVRRRWVRSVQRWGKQPRRKVSLAVGRLRSPSDVRGYVTFLAAMVL